MQMQTLLDFPPSCCTNLRISIEESLAIRDILSIMIDQLYMLVVFYSV
jgi:hypothetical protein